MTVKFNLRSVLYRLTIVLLILSLLSVNLPEAQHNAAFLDRFSNETQVTQAAAIPFLNLFRRKPAQKTPSEVLPRVYAGGMPVGLTLNSQGVIVLGVGNVMTAEGVAKPFAKSAVREGDIIIKIGSVDIASIADINRAINDPDTAGTETTVQFSRKGKIITEKITPAKDSASRLYKLGLWIRDTAAGVGTVTYVKPDLRFGALGHPICDADVGDIMPIRGGNVYECNIVGVVKGRKGAAGELRGIFLRNKKRIGNIEKNNKFGVFGQMSERPAHPLYCEPMECLARAEVKPGAAKILTTVGTQMGEYDAEIIKTNFQSSQKEKSMVIKITDERLLCETGGIVQGMSGSPILQNGKLAGAVTHVFINDPTKGFGVYIDWMLNE